MSIVFLVLRIFVIILAVLIGAIVLLCLLTIAVPVRYLADVRKERQVRGKVRLSWLMRALTLTLEYDGDDLDVRFRLLGIHLFKPKESVKKARGRRHEKKKQKNRDGKRTAESSEESGQEGKDVPVLREEIPREEVPRNETARGETSGRKEEGNAFKRLWTSFVNKCKALLDGLGKLRDWARWLCEFVRHPEHKLGFQTIKREGVRFFKHAKPKVFQARIKLGLGDPCQTGLALGALGVAYAYMGGGFQVEADFEEEVVEGFVFAKGRIRFLVVLGIGVRLYRDRGVRRMVNELRSRLA